MKSRGVPTPADGTRYVVEEVRGKGGPYTVGSPAACRTDGLGADTAACLEREVVFGHAYAILAPGAVLCGWCGYDNPTFLSVDGVKTRNPGPRRVRAGALDLEVTWPNPTTR